MSLDERNLEAHITRALQELLAGREPQQEDTSILTGDAKACIDAMTHALHTDGVQAVRKAFSALVKDRPWLGKLASQAASEGDESPSRRIRFLPDSAFENRPARQWLIPTILPRSAIAMIFGPPGCGKSFLAMAWSLCIASGTQWLGRPVLQGPVAYIAGEGSFGLGPRIRAWKHHHAFRGDSGVQWFDESLALQDSCQLQELLTACREDFSEPPVLVVIDTLSRCSGGADENSNTEMAKVIAAADLLQQQYHCTVLIVHHAGKDKDKGPRGASSLTGNTETILEVMGTTEGCRLVCFKQKDAPKFEPISLKMHPVQYGLGEDETSAVLILGSANARPALTKSESVMYAALQGKQLGFNEWVRIGMGGEARVIGKTSAENAIRELVRKGYVQKDGNLYSSIPQQEQEESELPEE